MAEALHSAGGDSKNLFSGLLLLLPWLLLEYRCSRSRFNFLMINLRYIFRLTRAFISRFKALILVSMGLGIAFFFFIRYSLPLLSDSRLVRIGMTGRYTLSTLPNPILDMIGNGLTKLDSNGNVEPDLASSWETPDKGKTWTFILKNNLYWQDGKRVVSSGINYQFSDVVIERPDDKTITFKLQNPYSAFPSVVSRPTFRSGLLGTGQFRVTDLSLNGSVVEQISMKKKDGENIIYKFYPTEERTKLALELGHVDKIVDVLDPSPFISWPKMKISEGSNTGQYVGVFLNTQDNLFKDKSIRQALSYAINKDLLGGIRAIGPISIDSWAYNPQVKPYGYDFAKAKATIDDYKKNAKAEEVSVNLSVTSILLKQAEMIAKDWEKVGIKVNLQVISQIPSDYQAFLAIFDIPDDPDQYSMWHSTQTATNITRYQDPRIDKLLEDGRSEINIDARKRIYFDFQRFLVEDSPAVFLYYPTIYTIGRE
ncbi:MAG: Extracellular solute-binding protein, family 5 [Candidatus Woesebacteria bacterium GW2011_GWB1_44_11]|uniref:Extracellular solute-binding protein, family 5 n=2 Tax=Candidatus Woeseibacteriota TaxID=1752722 RepID=A0A837IF69_9BACT|nr:MAG: Extracellular solute-binding protein, family 5 [Candidatus Woesebacteria bacterium GW2011_GWB1_44_11]